MDRSHVIFSNPMPKKVIGKAEKAKRKFVKKFGDDTQKTYGFSTCPNPTLNQALGIHTIDLKEGEQGEVLASNAIVIGTIRMGFGHYRISMAIASAAHALGYRPYWLDLHAYQQTTGGQVIAHLNKLYTMGSRWSQKYPLFNKLYWEPLNSEGFRKLSYNAMDQKVSELMAPICGTLPKEVPFVATHVWPAQAAVHAGMTHVVNAIPDNWPMALHLAEGAIHTVQTFSSYLGYKTLKGMAGEQVLQPMPEGTLFNTGHYIDHELVHHLEADCDKRLQRLENEGVKRILLTVGGAGAQAEIFAKIIGFLMPYVKCKKVCLFINVGDHKGVWETLGRLVPELNREATLYFDDWEKTKFMAHSALDEEIYGVHAFYHSDIFAAVYASNLLMRASDLLITKPSELSFYPLPKLMIKRVGGHEAWGAIRAAELGDGTIECETSERALQMLKLLIEEKAHLKAMIGHIKDANAIGVYNGAYEVVKLAVKGGLHAKNSLE